LEPFLIKSGESGPKNALAKNMHFLQKILFKNYPEVNYKKIVKIGVKPKKRFRKKSTFNQVSLLEIRFFTTVDSF
jgi:hypothetical protein